MKKISKIKGEEGIVVEFGIRNKNGPNQYFSITGTLGHRGVGGAGRDDFHIDGKRFRFSSGGCIHDDIIRFFPDMKDMIDMHLRSVHGSPMYAVENGFYWLKKAFGIYCVFNGNMPEDFGRDESKEKFLQVLKEHMMMSDSEIQTMIDKLGIESSAPAIRDSLIVIHVTEKEIGQIKDAISSFNNGSGSIKLKNEIKQLARKANEMNEKISSVSAKTSLAIQRIKNDFAECVEDRKEVWLNNAIKVIEKYQL